MSLKAMTWVFDHSEERLGRRLVLLALADRAADDGTGAYESVETIGKKARLSRSQVHRCLRELESAGAVVKRDEVSRYGTRIYDLVFGGSQIATGGSQIGPEAESDLRPDPSYKQPKALLPTVVELPRAPTIGKVDRRTVTTEEGKLAFEVLAAWNERTDQRLTAKTWLAKIVMRIREHPDLELADHARVIDRALASPWWRGVPTPSVVYGNDAVFERAMMASTVESDPERVLRVAREFEERHGAG